MQYRREHRSHIERHSGVRRHSRAVALPFLAPVAFAVAGCGAENGPTATKTAAAVSASPSPTALVITPLEGTWSTRFTATDVSSLGSHFDPGAWEVIIHGTFSTLYKPSGQIMDQSGFELTGPNAVVFPAENCYAEAQPAPGTYTFRITGSQLVFTKVQDGCVNRAFQLTAHPWTKQ